LAKLEAVTAIVVARDLTHASDPNVPQGDPVKAGCHLIDAALCFVLLPQAEVEPAGGWKLLDAFVEDLRRPGAVIRPEFDNPAGVIPGLLIACGKVSPIHPVEDLAEFGPP